MTATVGFNREEVGGGSVGRGEVEINQKVTIEGGRYIKCMTMFSIDMRYLGRLELSGCQDGIGIVITTYTRHKLDQFRRQLPQW